MEPKIKLTEEWVLVLDDTWILRGPFKSYVAINIVNSFNDPEYIVYICNGENEYKHGKAQTFEEAALMAENAMREELSKYISVNIETG